MRANIIKTITLAQGWKIEITPDYDSGMVWDYTDGCMVRVCKQQSDKAPGEVFVSTIGRRIYGRLSENLYAFDHRAYIKELRTEGVTGAEAHKNAIEFREYLRKWAEGDIFYTTATLITPEGEEDCSVGGVEYDEYNVDVDYIVGCVDGHEKVAEYAAKIKAGFMGHSPSLT